MCCQNDCKCGCKGHGHHGGSCSCHEGPKFGHWLWTKAEKIAWLEDRLADLQEETKAYEERIAALKAE
jgi:hypothetical protein